MGRASMIEAYSARRKERQPLLDEALLFGVFACAGALVCAAPCEAGVSALVTLVLFLCASRRGTTIRGALLAACAAACFFASTVRASCKVDAYEKSRASVEQDGRWPTGCTLRGTVVRSPIRIGTSLRTDLDVTDGACDSGTFRGLVALYVPLETAPILARGDVVEALARVAPVERFWNDGTGNPTPALARRGVVLSGSALDVVVRSSSFTIGHAIDVLRAAVRGRILETFPTETEAMARALVLGEGDLPSVDQEAFRRSGLSHLLAVSGMHLVIVVASFVAGLRAVLLRVRSLAVRVDVARIAALVGIPGAWFYADFAGGSGSAMRAAWMMSAALAVRVLGLRPDTWRALGLSIVGMMIVDPLAAYDVSFLLSGAATLGLVAFGRTLEAKLSAVVRGRASFVVRPMAATTAASLTCAPILACMSPDLSLSGLVANLVAVPLGEAAALPMCILHMVLVPFPSAERGAAFAASGALTLVRATARIFAGISWSVVPVPSLSAAQLGALFTLGFVALVPFKRRGWAALLACVALVAFERSQHAYGRPIGRLRVTFLDVGQGDSALIDLPDGKLVLVDAGGLVGSPVDVGQRVLAPLLRARRRTAIDVVILSHPHPDHFGGMLTGLSGVDVGQFWDTGQGENEGMAGGYAELLASLRARNVPIFRPSELCGTRSLGGVSFDVLAPCPNPSSDRGPNDNSFVVRLRYGERAILFVGDAEHEEERELVDTRSGALRADVLKVGHHGSRTSSSPAFLNAVAPQVAVMSCGVRNRYGHPHPNTLASLSRARISIHRTDRDGAILVTTDGTDLDVQSLSTTPMYGRLRYFSAKSSP